MPLEFFEYKVNVAVNRWVDDDKPISDTLIIPDKYRGKPVTEIKSNAFNGKKELKKVVIPSTIKVIGAYAFENCENLCVISSHQEAAYSTLPETLGIIETRAFANTKLSGILAILGKYLTIHDEAFENCHALSRVLISSEDLKLGKGTFRSCDQLELVMGRPKIETVPEECFSYCSKLKAVTLQFRSVAERGFYLDSQLEFIKPLGKRLKSVGKDAFFGCKSLEMIPEKWKGQDNVRNKATKQANGTIKEQTNLANTEATGEQPAVGQNDDAILEMIWNEKTIEPLFKLKIEGTENRTGVVPTKIKGSFQNFVNRKFSVILPTTLCAAEFICADVGKVGSIIDYLADENCTVFLHGKAVGNMFEVYDIEPAAKSGPLTNTDFFHELIRRTQESLNHEEFKNEKPYYLRTQDEFKTFLATCSATLPLWVQEAAQRELFTLTHSSKLGDQATHAQLALEFLLNIDWNPPSNLYVPEIQQARDMLDEEFYGMDDVKQIFLELIAKMQRTRTLPEEALLLVGPPGVGKTYIINAISKILKLPVVQMDFSGVGKSPDEVTGSNRVYSNAKPGMFLQGCHTHRTSTVLLFLNEIDKAAEKAGSEVLLSLLDGAGMKEGFLELVIPTHVLAIASANDLSKLSPALKSRFRIVHIDPFGYKEKLEIWRNHALPQALEKSNVAPKELQFSAEAEETLVKQYATEAGCRDVYGYARDFIGRYCYKTAIDQNIKSHIYSANEVKEILGPAHQIYRPFVVHPGAVRFGYMFQGQAILSMLQVSVEEGTGKLEILGAIPAIQKQYTRIAWKAVKQTTNYDLRSADVTVFFNTPILNNKADNIVGMPVFLGICSALLHTPLNLADVLLYGCGIDLFGNVYLDNPTPTTPFINVMEEEGISLMYGPTGLCSRFDFSKCKNSPIILESHNGEALVRMIMTNSKYRSQ